MGLGCGWAEFPGGPSVESSWGPSRWASIAKRSRLCNLEPGMETARFQLWPALPAACVGGEEKRSATGAANAA